VFGNGTRADVPLICPSSNYTWLSYDTLGTCSECITATQLLDFGYVYTRVDWTSQLNATVSAYPDATVCESFLNITSLQLTLMSGYMVSEDGKFTSEAILMRTLPLITNSVH
jgi:hypothetical protein